MPTALQLPLELRDGEVVIDYLGAGDQLWLRALIELFDACAGKPQRELRDRLAEPLPVPTPWAKRQAATAVLRGLFHGVTRCALPPPRARAALFAAAAGRRDERRALLRETAAGLGLSPDELWRSLFADVPGEREVAFVGEIPAPTEVALRTNLAIVQQLIHRSALVRLRAEGNVRALVRLAKLRGLICMVRDDAPVAFGQRGAQPPLPGLEAGSRGAHLELSGPLSLFRRTLLYGRALADLVPLLAWCPRFHLEASCQVRGETARLTLASGAPIFPAKEPRRFDSALEERFARDFARAAPDWDLVREPEAFRAGGTLVFPDFLLRHRREPGRRFLLELVGFWTRAYLEKKLASLRAAAIPNLILCIDEDRNCAEGELPLGANVIRFHRRLDPATVLEILEGRASARATKAPPEVPSSP